MSRMNRFNCKRILGFLLSVSVLSVSIAKAESYLTIENDSTGVRYLAFQAYHSGHRQKIIFHGATYYDGQLITVPNQATLLVILNSIALQSSGRAYIYKQIPASNPDRSKADCILWWQQNSEDAYCFQKHMSAVRWEKGNELTCGIHYNNMLPPPSSRPCGAIADQPSS